MTLKPDNRQRDPVEKVERIFHVAPWLKTEGKAIHIPVSGMDEFHQLTWPDLRAIVSELLCLRDHDEKPK